MYVIVFMFLKAPEASQARPARAWSQMYEFANNKNLVNLKIYNVLTYKFTEIYTNLQTGKFNKIR